MESQGLSWWGAWVLWCVPVGALAGVGLIEFNWGGPPYDGGFLGDLILFGGFLALGQALFVAVFVLALCGWAAEQTGCVAVLSALAWSLVGFVGWTMGSYFEVGLATPLYSNLSAPFLKGGTHKLVTEPPTGEGEDRAEAS